MYDPRRVEELIARWENGERDAEMRKVRNEVFDVLTLRNIYKLMERRVIGRLLRVISTGKEANVFEAMDPRGNPLAVKLYRVETSEFRHLRKYIEGDPRFGRLRRDRRHLVDLWTRKEFKNLDTAYRHGVSVPVPFAVRGNVLVMELITKDGAPAPLLRSAELEDPEGFAESLLDSAGRLYFGAGLVHADLSEYNILVSDRGPVIIDMGQSVPWDHPLSVEFFRRDMDRLRGILASLGREYSFNELVSILKERGAQWKKM